MSRYDFPGQAAAAAAYDNAYPYDDAQAAADEARDEHIEDNAPARAKALLLEPDFAWTAISDLPNEAQLGFAEDLGRFFEAYHAGQTDAELARAGYALWRTLTPYVEAAAMDQAREEVADEYDAEQVAFERGRE